MTEQPAPLPKREPGAVYVNGRLVGEPEPVDNADAEQVGEAFRRAITDHVTNPLNATVVFHDPEFIAGLEALLAETGEALMAGIATAATPLFDEVAADLADPLTAPIPEGTHNDAGT